MTWKFLLLLFVSCSAASSEWTESETIQEVFESFNVSGGFVLYDQSNDEYIFHDKRRINTRYIPASTFKIANALIGLNAGTVKSVDEILPYGGLAQPIKSWENDMGLRNAIKLSNVPIFQELARRTGIQQMRAEIRELNYGNTVIGDSVDRFWLDGPLKINAIEQVNFLTQLAESRLTVSRYAQQSVREILRVDSSGNCQLYGKTGWVGTSEPEIGWWVGWLQREDQLYSFALIIDIQLKRDAKARTKIGRQVLIKSGLWPCD
jgi:beta-lactamase class D